MGGSIATFGTATPAITTSLVSTDRVVVVVQKGGTAGTPSASGLGGTWVTDVSITSTYDEYIISTSGVTGTGTVTVSVGSSAGDYQLYVLRSSVSNAVVFVSGSGNQASAAGGGTLLSLTSSSVSAGSLWLVGGNVGSGTLVFPHSSSSPNSGYTTDRSVSAGLKYLSRQVAADESMSITLTDAAAYNGAIIRANYYDNNVPTPPPSSGFTGWGVPIF